jgi:hypothetical protein
MLPDGILEITFPAVEYFPQFYPNNSTPDVGRKFSPYINRHFCGERIGPHNAFSFDNIAG